MTLFELAAEVWSRGGELRAIDGRVRYRSPELAADDPIRAAIAEHRDALLALAVEYERRQGAEERAEAAA
jgi:hypothetical protein